MKRISVFSSAVVAMMVLAAPVFAASSVFNAHLSGKEQVPVRDTNATGQVKFVLSSDLQTLDFRVNVSNIDNVIAVRLENAPAGATGPEIAVLYGPVAPGGGKSAGVLATGKLTAANLVGPMAGRTIADLIAEIQAGRVYVNVITDDGLAGDEKPGDFSSGEIRGQIQ
jgi:hypothetical protein